VDEAVAVERRACLVGIMKLLDSGAFAYRREVTGFQPAPE